MLLSDVAVRKAKSGEKNRKMADEKGLYLPAKKGRHAEWLEFDLIAKQWVIPAERMKMKRSTLFHSLNSRLAFLKSCAYSLEKGGISFPVRVHLLDH